RITIADTDTIKLPTLQVKVYLRGAQMSDPDLTSVLAVFQRAANLLARLEDALIFNGQLNESQAPAGGPPNIWEVLGGQPSRGLLATDAVLGGANPPPSIQVPADGELLVAAVSDAIGALEGRGHFGPFAVALGQKLFLAAQTPNRSLVLPQDRIIPFLGGGGSLVRSSTLPDNKGVVVALGGAPVELVIATDVSLNFLQVTSDPMFVFRVYEKMALRIKESDAIVALVPPAAPAAGAAAGPAAPPAGERRRDKST
ncbi:MAG TPA: family 1 encapsulin nanocompartment shell protein, partial [Bradyrhizobium sp.]|nr:family 1 encapsulin nanocompartment shell protein [Bradyrhizobium sp.]